MQGDGFLSKIIGYLVTGVVLLTTATSAMGSLAPTEPENPTTTLTRIFAPHLLPPRSAHDTTTQHCGVEVAALVSRYWAQLSPELQAYIPNDFRPPEFQDPSAKATAGTDVCDLSWDTPHFRIHYSTDPDHQPPGYPDLQAVYDLGSYLETAYAYHRDISGMGVALTKGLNEDGTELLDCYFYDTGDALWGYARGLWYMPTDCGNTYAGLIAVTINFEQFGNTDQLRLTSEHEYYHLLQYAHNPHQYSWFMESTARNSEFHVWPDQATPRGARVWMQFPYYSLWDDSGFHRYAPHFWFYLEAHHGWDFVTRMWDRSCEGLGTPELLNAELAAAGANIDDTIVDFALWNYFTDWRDDGEHYNPDFNLPAVYYQANYQHFPVPPTSLATRAARPAGSNYVRFNGPASANNLQINFEGTPELANLRKVTVIGINDWGHQAWTLTPDVDGDVEFTVSGWDLYDHVVLVVTNFWDAPEDSALLRYTYAAAEVSGKIVVDQQTQLVSSAPNPFTESTRVMYVAPQGGSTTRIRVYDLAGRLLRILADESVFEGSHQVVWDGRDQQGARVPTGMYFIRLENGSYEQVQKVMFVR